MRATRFTHVSIHAYDLEESTRFYVDVFGMRRVPAPDFEHPVVWLEVGDQQLHLFHRDTPAPEFHHIGLDVDDFEAAYSVALERGLFDRDAWSPNVRVLNDGAVQMYLRDPAGNLVELDHDGVARLPEDIRAQLKPLWEINPQDEEQMRGRLFVGDASAGTAA
jgi:catechol 2,3-dioxygenase-like lactoylglutathione lyase family enzyme